MSTPLTCTRCDRPRVKNHSLCQEHRNAYMREWNRRNPDAARHHSFMRRYGISLADYDELLEAQGGVCAICGGPEPIARLKYLSVDHDHETGAVRGLLCSDCNKVLGYAKDSVAHLRAAITYLEGAP